MNNSSVATLHNTVQVNTSFENNLHNGSSLIASGSTSFRGDASVGEFANVTLYVGTNVLGSLSCSSGGDAYCENPAGVTGSSDCGQCPKP